MRGDATFCHEVDFGPDSVWGVERYFEEQLEYFSRWLPDDAAGQPAGEAPIRIFVMGGGSGRRTAEGKLDHGGRWRDEHEWPLARAVETTFYLHGDGSLSRQPPVVWRRDASSPTTRPIPCRRSAASTAPSASSPRRGRGWSRRGRASSTRCSAFATCSRPGRPISARRSSSSAPSRRIPGCPSGPTCSSSRRSRSPRRSR